MMNRYESGFALNGKTTPEMEEFFKTYKVKKSSIIAKKMAKAKRKADQAFLLKCFWRAIFFYHRRNYRLI